MAMAEVPIMALHKSMNVDLEDKDLDDLSIGDIVTVRVVGKVRSLSAGMKPSKEEKKEKHGFKGFPPDMTIEVTETKVEVGNDFSELVDED